MKFSVIDFETTGIPTDDDRGHQIVEAAIATFDPAEGHLAVPAPLSWLVNPGRPIPVEAKAVHNITDKMVKTAIRPEEAFTALMTYRGDFWVAHNADFERQFFGGGDTSWICTYKVACRLWPDAPSHSNQALRYYLDPEGFPAPDWFNVIPHRAGGDVWVTSHILVAAIALGTSVDDMVKWTKGPALLPRIKFGKHAGTKFKDLPVDYLQWMVRQDTMDRDAKATARYWLKELGHSAIG